jgi:AcrR family transcriptional regulator
MPKVVKRSYSSATRAAQAKATRSAILGAARMLFIDRGYAATTIQAIAEEAGVAVQTVYAVFGNKRRVLDEMIEAAIVGDDDEPGTATESEPVQAIAAEPDRRRRAALDAAVTRAISERVAPIVRVAAEAAASDPQFAAVYEAMKARRREEMKTMVKVLGGAEGVRMRAQEAAATLYVLYSPQVADMLMIDYGWSAERYENWLADMLYQALLA